VRIRRRSSSAETLARWKRLGRRECVGKGCARPCCLAVPSRRQPPAPLGARTSLFADQRGKGPGPRARFSVSGHLFDSHSLMRRALQPGALPFDEARRPA
jgi:hypothetical protein